ncbi:hypothetical protein S7711_03760 [Stachybotrys chartarum IBT 7711]|uniref:PH domain-containing protein n=1 Tax=Stachybotrys chartarum (strain CBS 109288 / IBT 7711) TaxID=1280523 RepID=A0A084AWV2_STACB|nr:hypothetical protein S7711_03760 [Stachybotrys chartarum IBT 7711]KFA49422.1 hypothetical protein S40293_05790 [Stachybotrys chartarum IBT 40293]
MDSLEGILLSPPDRNQILGRAVWKPRYVVVGRRTVLYKDQPAQHLSQAASARASTSGPKSLARVPTEEYCISVFKSKDDLEPLQQWSINAIIDCQVQMLAHRKQGPVLPTLVLTLADRDRKRRSSRAAGLMSGKDCSSTSLWFRAAPEYPWPSIHDWARFITSRKGPVTPITPTSPDLANAATRQDTSDGFPQFEGYASRGDGRVLQHKASTATYSTGTRERPKTFSSASPSLRSKRSDISSPSTTSNYPIQHMGYPIPGQAISTNFPTDLPSPRTEYHGEFIEGWTSAQGRSSTVSSPIHGRDSISSQAVPSSIADSSSPPAPRETILDRAFQMRYIPGSENETPGEDKLSSLARFEALMREADEKRRRRETASQVQNQKLRSAFDRDDSSDSPGVGDDQDSDSDDANFVHEYHEPQSPSLIPPTTQRALDFITNRHEPFSPQSSHRLPFPKPIQSMRADSFPLRTRAPPPRPHTAHAKSRPNGVPRSNSTPQAVSAVSQFETPSAMGKTLNEPTRPSLEKRQSSSSTKRLSFTDFTKRLSSTSSLLLVQTNTSGGSNRVNGEPDAQPNISSRPSMNPRSAGAPPRERDRDSHDKKCGWRGSVGVVGTDGGFV